jgi:hypothetical protein
MSGSDRRENITMRFPASIQSIVVLGLVMIAGALGVARAADPDWKAVEQALGRPGQMMPGDVYRVGMPRTDLNVTVKGVPVKAGFASAPTPHSSRSATTPW